MTGPEEIGASHRRSFARFAGTQHLLTGHDVAIDGGAATVRVNLVAMHMWREGSGNINNPDDFFVAGGVIDVKLAQADGRWKITWLRNANLWRGGGFKDMARTGEPSTRP
jgi:hypothetical protein